MTEADGAWRRGRGDEVVVDADLVDGLGRSLNALGGEGRVQAREVLRGQELQLAAGGRDGERRCQLGRHCGGEMFWWWWW